MTADRNEPTGGRPSHLSRRRLLAGLGGVSAVGMASGAGTFAYLSGRESFARNTLGAGEIGIDVSCSGSTDCAASDGLTRLAIDGLDRGSHGERTATITVRTNPARVWFATICPDPELAASDPLGEALVVELFVGDGSMPVFSGSLSALRRELAGGVRIDDRNGTAKPCLDPGAELDITLDWELPADAPDAAAGRTTAFEFRLYAEQCRHVSEAEAAASNPFAGLDPCDEPAPDCGTCDDGARYLDLTFRYDGETDATIRVTTQRTGSDPDAVVFDGTVAAGATFTADGRGVQQNWSSGIESLGRNTTIEVVTEGSENASDDVEIHTSCSTPITLGDAFGSDGTGGALYELVGGTFTDGEPLCGSEEL